MKSVTVRVRQLGQKSALVTRLWSPLRGRAQERRIAAERSMYERRAAAAGVRVPADDELRARLRARIADRGVHPKPSGLLHIIHVTRLSDWEAHNIPSALRCFGTVTPFYLGEQGFDDQGDQWCGRRAEFARAFVEFVRETHRRRPVDVVFAYLSGWHIDGDAIRRINDLGIVTCNMCLDDRLLFVGDIRCGRPTGPAPLVSAIDLNLTNSADSIIKYFAEGGLAIFWPEGANPEHFRPLARSFDFDVSFIGARYGRRTEYVDYLRRHGCSVATFGPGWSAGQVPASEMVEIYARSRINLGFSGIGYSMRETCLKGRDFEVPMSGAVYLTTEQPDLHRVFEVGRDVFTYRDKHDCLVQIRRLLAEPDLCAATRTSARAVSLECHSWESRFRQLFQVLGFQ